MTSLVPFIRPALPSVAALGPDLAAIASSNWYSNFGPYERSFRDAISDYLGGDLSVVTVNSATTGLMAALASLLPRGEGTSSIAIASFTFAAGAQAIIWHGYQPAWIDVDPVSLQPSISAFRELYSQDPKVRAILLTNTFGIGNSEIQEWEALANELSIPLIIDSAAGFGSRYTDRERVGLRGACEVFSFHATKPFAIGEGGAIVTRDRDLAEKMRQFTNFGFDGPNGATRVGLNGKLQELNAAIGLHQLSTFNAAVQHRQEILAHYVSEFAALPLTTPLGAQKSSVCFASFTFSSNASLMSALSALRLASVDARSYYSPSLHRQSFFSARAPLVALPYTDSLGDRTISLPVLPDMTSEEIDLVVRTVLQSQE